MLCVTVVRNCCSFNLHNTIHVVGMALAWQMYIACQKTVPCKSAFCMLYQYSTYVDEKDNSKGVVWCVLLQFYQPVYCETNRHQHIYHWNGKKCPLNTFQASKCFYLKTTYILIPNIRTVNVTSTGCVTLCCVTFCCLSCVASSCVVLLSVSYLLV